MEQFRWVVEPENYSPKIFTENGLCDSIFRKVSVRLPSGRFSVSLPFHQPVFYAIFVGSRAVPEWSFDSLECKLLTFHALKASFISLVLFYLVLTECVSLWHMSVADYLGYFYIPHRAACCPDNHNSNICLIFDVYVQSFSRL